MRNPKLEFQTSRLGATALDDSDREKSLRGRSVVATATVSDTASFPTKPGNRTVGSSED
jgi:hypothetical protein